MKEFSEVCGNNKNCLTIKNIVCETEVFAALLSLLGQALSEKGFKEIHLEGFDFNVKID